MTDPAHELPDVEYAGFWRRFGAYIIDSVILAVVYQILTIITNIDTGSEFAGPQSPEEILFSLVLIAISWLYFALLESSEKQATFGKMALGMQVTDDEGKRISFAKATGRFFGKIISGMILMIGYLMIIWTEKKQALHDKMVRTLVIKQ